MRDLKLPEQRHPEKAHRPDNAQPRKPDWIRVKAPGGKGYTETREIMRGPHTRRQRSADESGAGR